MDSVKSCQINWSNHPCCYAATPWQVDYVDLHLSHAPWAPIPLCVVRQKW